MGDGPFGEVMMDGGCVVYSSVGGGGELGTKGVRG